MQARYQTTLQPEKGTLKKANRLSRRKPFPLSYYTRKKLILLGETCAPLARSNPPQADKLTTSCTPCKRATRLRYSPKKGTLKKANHLP